MIPVDSTTYYAACRLARYTMGQHRLSHFRHVHPTADCQPWSEGFYIPYGDYIVRGDFTELSESYGVNAKFLKAVRYDSHPCVFRYP